jgi:hypothetical protein
MVLQITLSYPEFTPTNLYRVRHDVELPQGIWRPGLPEVHPLYPNHHSPFGRAGQLLSKSINPGANGGKLTALYHFGLWIANNQGFGMDTPRANWFLGKDLDAELPRVEALLCGGSTYHGQDLGDYVAIQMLNCNQLPETIEQTFWTAAVYCGSDGTPRKMLQSETFSEQLFHPAIANVERYPSLVIEKWKLKKVDKVYNPLDI